MSDTPPQSEPNVEVRMMMPPTSANVRIIEQPGQPKQVAIQLNTIYGSLAIAFEPNLAIDFAAKIRKHAKDANSGIQRVATPLLGADGQALSVPDNDAVDEAELAAEEAAVAAKEALDEAQAQAMELIDAAQAQVEAIQERAGTAEAAQSELAANA